jgi:hypothetical protein
MARETNKAVLADRQNPAQPALFDDQSLPACLPVLESVKARRYEHLGVRLMEDDVKAQRLVELITMKWGVKKISREMSISAHTVRAARRALVAQGKMAPYRQRIIEGMEDAIEAGIYVLRDAIEDGTMKAAQLSVPIAIMFDKRALAAGEPTSILGGGSQVNDDVSTEALNKYLESLPSCKPATEDSASLGNGLKPEQNSGVSQQDTTLDTASAGQTAGGELFGPAATGHAEPMTDPTAVGTRPDPATGPGGGPRPVRRWIDSILCLSENENSKDQYEPDQIYSNDGR